MGHWAIAPTEPNGTLGKRAERTQGRFARKINFNAAPIAQKDGVFSKTKPIRPGRRRVEPFPVRRTILSG
jgi:hypothetical protein